MSLQIDEDFGYQKTVWRVERAGWVVLAVVLLAAVLGLFGPGIFGTARATAPNDRLAIEYLRFVRSPAPHDLRMLVQPQSTGSGRFRLWIQSTYLSGVTLENITPEPDKMLVGKDRITFEFAWDEAPGRVPITFELTPDDYGPLIGQIGIDDSVVEIRQFVYP